MLSIFEIKIRRKIFGAKKKEISKNGESYIMLATYIILLA